MPILRKPKHENFTMVRNYFINDTRLKPDGKGVLLFMLSKPDDWSFKYENLMVGLGIGEKYLRSCIKQLEDLKYLKRSKCRGENGHYIWNYYIYEEPYDMELKKGISPGIPLGDVVEGDVLDGNNIQSTNELNTKELIDKIDKPSQGLINEKVEHNILTNELIELNYLTRALKSEFYYEAIFIEYAIIEDRTDSILRHANVTIDKPTLNNKIKAIKINRVFKNEYVTKHLSLDLLDSIKQWKNKRNALIHDLINLSYSNEDIKKIALEGQQIVKK